MFIHDGHACQALFAGKRFLFQKNAIFFPGSSGLSFATLLGYKNSCGTIPIITQKRAARKTMEARTHHTVFTYSILPGLFFEDPVKLLFLLTDTENEGRGIIGLWMQVGKDLMAKGHSLISPAGLGAAKAAIWGEHAVVVQLPEVLAPGEADFACLLSQQGRPLYLTYERLPDPDAPDPDFSNMPDDEDDLDAECVLCGWNAAGEHINYELCGPPELEHFLSLVEKFLQESRE